VVPSERLATRRKVLNRKQDALARTEILPENAWV